MKKNLLLGCLFTVLSLCAKAQTGQQNNSSLNERKPRVLKLYPNPSPGGVVSIVSSKEELLYFYIFDMEGNLVYQALLKNKEKKIVANLPKGTYLYTAFENDQSIEEGKLIIK